MIKRTSSRAVLCSPSSWGLVLSLTILATACTPPAVTPSATDAPAAEASVSAPAEPVRPPEAPVATAVSASPPAIPIPPRPHPDPDLFEPHEACAPIGPEPQVCVLPGETRGALLRASDLPGSPAESAAVRRLGCRDEPKQPICCCCRARFVKVEQGRCCYVGNSKLPRCKE
jgi:hypothetical protein